MILEKIKTKPEEITFQEVISFIDNQYDFNSVKFKNGNLTNEIGQNLGSCKIFSFAKINNLTQLETLFCFGDFYRKDVLNNPEGSDHQNIRNFIVSGWECIFFEGIALIAK
jgi:hypothetical protein